MIHTTFSKLNNDSDSYIIAEVGQNHQGSVSNAIEYISKFASLGANAVKFQVRDNKSLFDPIVYDSPYQSDNSFGDTYGQHREALELSPSELLNIRNHAKTLDIDFIVTPFDLNSVNLCVDLAVDCLKVASFDMGNLGIISAIAQARIPIVLSTGGATIDQIKSSVDEILKVHSDFSILHCVSYYPCPASKLSLDKIKLLKELFPNITIGLSDHFNGILSGPLAYMLGARVFEKHVTFDRSQKGTDHPFSLEPDGFRKFVRDIRRVPEMCSIASNDELGHEPVFQKLGKCLVARHDLCAGHILTVDDLDGRIVRPAGIPVRRSNELFGRQLISDLSAGTYINFAHLVNV